MEEHVGDELPDMELADPFMRAVLSPAHPLVVVLHDEAESQNRNPFEEAWGSGMVALGSRRAIRLMPLRAQKTAVFATRMMFRPGR